MYKKIVRFIILFLHCGWKKRNSIPDGIRLALYLKMYDDIKYRNQGLCHVLDGAFYDLSTELKRPRQFWLSKKWSGVEIEEFPELLVQKPLSAKRTGYWFEFNDSTHRKRIDIVTNAIYYLTEKGVLLQTQLQTMF